MTAVIRPGAEQSPQPPRRPFEVIEGGRKTPYGELYGLVAEITDDTIGFYRRHIDNKTKKTVAPPGSSTLRRLLQGEARWPQRDPEGKKQRSGKWHFPGRNKDNLVEVSADVEPDGRKRETVILPRQQPDKEGRIGGNVMLVRFTTPAEGEKPEEVQYHVRLTYPDGADIKFGTEYFNRLEQEEGPELARGLSLLMYQTAELAKLRAGQVASESIPIPEGVARIAAAAGATATKSAVQSA